MEVVHCNYAHLYGGKFSWTSDLSAPQSRHHEQVDVELVGGLATCSGAASDTENGRTRTGPIAGMGLFAIEFERDSASRPVYRITVACPSPDWPAGPNGEPATPSKPAELGHDEQQSYDQPAPAPPGMKLVGSYTTPAAETDALNGVSGSLTVTWTLCPSAKYVVPPPTNAGQRLPRTCL